MWKKKQHAYVHYIYAYLSCLLHFFVLILLQHFVNLLLESYIHLLKFDVQNIVCNLQCTCVNGLLLFHVYLNCTTLSKCKFQKYLDEYRGITTFIYGTWVINFHSTHSYPPNTFNHKYFYVWIKHEIVFI